MPSEVQADRAELPTDPKVLHQITLGEPVKRYRDTVSIKKRAFDFRWTHFSLIAFARGDYLRFDRKNQAIGTNMDISVGEFDRQFERFKLSVRLASGVEFRSFHEGIAARWEDYKPRLRKHALSLLDAPNWSEASLGRGRILPKVISAIEIADRDLPNNLVRWENRWGPANQSHNAMLDALSSGRGIREFERLLFSLFRGQAVDAEIFEQLRALAGNKYDLLAYLFFLKDAKRYMPIATQTFDKAFRLLGSDLVTARQCSWDNYRRYNAVLSQVQLALRDRAEISKARLIDAHSFCWMLVRIEKELSNGNIESATRSFLQEAQVNICIAQMADTVEQTVASSNGQIVNRISKDKRLLMSRQELEMLIARRLVSQEKRCVLTGIYSSFPAANATTSCFPRSTALIAMAIMRHQTFNLFVGS